MSELILGQWNVICDQCGVERKSGQVTKRWDGLIVCKPDVRPGCFEHRHPQDFVRAIPEDTSVPFVRSDSEVDANGRPVLSSAPDINCDVLEARWYPSIIKDYTIVGKGYSYGPIVYEGDATVEVLCTWEVR